jgi:hypothetical protein
MVGTVDGDEMSVAVEVKPDTPATPIDEHHYAMKAMH